MIFVFAIKVWCQVETPDTTMIQVETPQKDRDRPDSTDRIDALQAEPDTIIIPFNSNVMSKNRLGSEPDKNKMLLMNINVQIDATQAVNDMYNFKFKKAEKQFTWLKQKFPDHPLPYFLLGLSQWWKIVPNLNNEAFDFKPLDKIFHAYMDTTIVKAEKIYKNSSGSIKIEAAFFLGGAYGFKARVYSDRKMWRKATFASKNAFHYLQESKGHNDLSPEFLFGEGLYNYYAVWIPENYVLLRPIVALFPDGDKELGIKQLREVSLNAFYTRTEAQYHLMRIYANEEDNLNAAFQISEYLAQTFPDNAYFQRFFARLTFVSGKQTITKKVSLGILEKIDKNMPGYEDISGRYAAFFLGHIYSYKYKDFKKAQYYFRRAVQFGENIKAYDSYYYLSSLAHIARIADKEGDKKIAKIYYRILSRRTKKKDDFYKEAKNYLGRKKEK